MLWLFRKDLMYLIIGRSISFKAKHVIENVDVHDIFSKMSIFGQMTIKPFPLIHLNWYQIKNKVCDHENVAENDWTKIQNYMEKK
jgi:hypothetical protein